MELTDTDQYLPLFKKHGTEIEPEQISVE